MNFNSPSIGIGILASMLALACGTVQASGASQRYQDECSQCHGDAAEFVADSLEVRNGSLTGLGSEMPVSEFLKDHQSLEQDDIDYYVDLLNRVAKEIGLR